MTERINKSFFRIQTEEMAYVLGYIYADGSLFERSRGGSWILDITSKDYEHLKNIARTMGSKYKIGSKYVIARKKRYKNYRIQITNCKICDDLKKLGFGFKDKTKFPPDVPAKFYPDFIRGYFDGDGSVYIYKVNGSAQLKGNVSCKDKETLLWINRFLNSALSFSCKNIYQNKRKIWEICFYQRECEKLFRFMYYKKGLLCLERKYKIFESWFSGACNNAN